ncbi:unnamed protein product [Litomosoides sigmodontis]|uniref:IgGFc-binding protein N-terminal domain-containing protein n=1 Tax=Litomosoides sigmodontis TaxID=42156 RepID=A0A3P6TXR2_LITSI|nr:unnamed protein product [Litomosoides sigmodontis]
MIRIYEFLLTASMAHCFIGQTILTALCLKIVCANEIDTYGREFIFVYPPNNSGSRGVKATLSIINPNTTQHADVTIDYPEFDSTAGTANEKASVVRRTTTLAVKFTFHESVILDGIVNGLRSYLDARIVVHSTISITLIAHSVDVCGAQDSFLASNAWSTVENAATFAVLPVSMAGNNYAFALPPSSLSGSTTIYFLPAKAAPYQYITINLIRQALSSSCKYTAKVDTMLVFSTSGESVTLWAHSNVTFVIVAAIRGLPTLKGSNIFDFGCFMPSSMPTTSCNELLRKDIHVAPLVTGKYHLLTPPSTECESSEISIHGSNKVVKTKHLVSTFVQTTNPVILDEYGNTAVISTATMLNIIRYGGYNVGASGYEEGGYLHEVPSVSQFISGMIPIIVPGDSNQVIVIADYKAMSNSLFDGEISLSFAALPFENSSLYYASGTVSSGFHFFYSDGLYMIFITGRTNKSAYGFLPAFNSREVVKMDYTTSELLICCICSSFDAKN